MKATLHPCGATRLRSDRIGNSGHETRLGDDGAGYRKSPGIEAEKVNGFEK
ncbi:MULTISPECIES: hypothetical protein [Mesorhizobium]|uniref:hypothetical protein n=1 Tax=Mesorhizobium TaxID=68287 RepID=UPI0012DB1D1A|nr:MULTISPECIES: hypothetical protein [Mesorhizobium]